MKRLNNRGFAISTLLYGLMIMSLLVVLAMFGNMSTNRQNTTSFVDKVEDELNRLSMTSTEGSNTGSGAVDQQGREYIAPEAGWYKIELWGARGGASSSYPKGAYVSGIIYLDDNDHIYFYTGAVGGSSGTMNSGSSGGGATDVRLISGDWNDEESLASRIMVAAGGGSAGAGGAISGLGNNPGKQSSTTKASSSGGGGYGGSTGTGGGSSYIAGYAGVVSPTGQTYQSFTIHRGEYNSDGTPITESYTPVIYNGMMISGVSDGAGKFRVAKVSDNDRNNPPRRGSNTKLNNVVYIRDCITGSSSGTNIANWLEIQAIKDGVRQELTYSGATGSLSNSAIITDGKADTPGTYASISASGKKCVTYRLKSAMNLDEIAVWHNYSYTTTSSRVTGHELSVSSNGSSWSILRAASTDTSTVGQQNEYETSNGIRYNSFQYDSTGALPEGNYYIFSSEKENEVLTLKLEGENYVTEMKPFTGDATQVWRVYKNGSSYHIQNTQYQKDFVVLDTDLVYLNDPDLLTQNQNVSISPLQNGYYTISPADNANVRVELYSNTLYSNPKGSSHSQRWKFVIASY